MTFSEYAGTAIVPTLARLVLAAAFVTAGYNKVFRTAEYDENQATILKNMGVTVTPVNSATPVTLADPSAPNTGVEWRVIRTAYHPLQDQPAPAATAPQTGGGTTHPVITTTLPPGKYQASAMYHIALMVHDQHWGLQPIHEKWLAWVGSYAELVGGFMMLIGLLSRFWGLVLAVQMCVAFYLYSMLKLDVHHHLRDFFDWAMNPANSTAVFIQLSLFVLALGVMLTGAGPLSLDRLLFGGPARPANPPPPPPERINRLEPIGGVRR